MLIKNEGYAELAMESISNVTIPEVPEAKGP